MRGQNREFAIALSILALGLVLSLQPVLAEVLPFGLKIERVMDSTAEIADLTQSPTGDLWILEKTGTIRFFVGGIEGTPLVVPVSTTCDSGLLGVAFAPGFADNGLAFIYYVDSSGNARVDEVRQTYDTLTLGSTIINVGSTASGCSPGGGLAVGPEGLLYVAVGDLGVPADAQDPASNAGKLLRAKLDGGVPGDNPSGTLVWATGFRDPRGLAINPTTTRPNGTVYLADVGQDPGIYDELNAVTAGGDHGWSVTSGPDTDATTIDPLVSAYSLVLDDVEVLSGDKLGDDAAGTLAYACSATGIDEIRQGFLSGSEMDGLDHSATLYDPDGDRDNVPDPGCPKQFTALAETGDGWLYAANGGTNPGIWRFWQDGPGPREVSAAGSPFPLTLAKDGSNLQIGWEKLGSVNVGRPDTHAAGQRPEIYRIWEGPLPIDGTFTALAGIQNTDGLPDPNSQARLTATISPATGSSYYLVTAQGDNTEGPLGAGRPPQEDFCDTIGWGTAVGLCAEDWVEPLIDWNPASPSYGKEITLSDFRGKVIRLDISAFDCFFCSQMAINFLPLDLLHRDRDLVIITVLMKSFGSPGWTPYPAAECQAGVAAWSQETDGRPEYHPVVCATSLAVPNQYDLGGCGTPQSFWIDQGNVMYQDRCGAGTNYPAERGWVINEINPETCE